MGTSTKELTKFIKESGCDDVESIRFRSVAFDNLNLTKKVSFILQKNRYFLCFFTNFLIRL